MIYVFFNPLSNNKKGTLAEIELRKKQFIHYREQLLAMRGKEE